MCNGMKADPYDPFSKNCLCVGKPPKPPIIIPDITKWIWQPLFLGDAVWYVKDFDAREFYILEFYTRDFEEWHPDDFVE